MKNISEINLEGCSCEILKELSIKNCLNLENIKFSKYKFLNLEKLVLKGENKINSENIFESFNHLSPSKIKVIQYQNKFIKKIDINTNHKMDDEKDQIMNDYSSSKFVFSEIETINLKYCFSLKEIKLDRVKKVKNIYMDRIMFKDDDVRKIIHDLTLKSIEKISLYGCIFIKSPISIKINSLTYLDLSQTKINDITLNLITDLYCENLETLKLFSCQNLQTPVIKNHSLKKIFFSQCLNITKIDIQCKKLEELELTGSLIDDEALFFMFSSSYFTNLVSLDLSFSNGLIFPFFFNFKNLNTLNFSYCKNISYFFITNLLNLNSLILHNCKIHLENLYLMMNQNLDNFDKKTFSKFDYDCFKLLHKNLSENKLDILLINTLDLKNFCFCLSGLPRLQLLNIKNIPDLNISNDNNNFYNKFQILN
jgi:hypothetical protein